MSDTDRGGRDPSPNDRPAPDVFVEAASDARASVDELLGRLDGAFPGPASEGYTYPETDAQDGWTESFWTGLLWLCYETTGSPRYRDTAHAHVDRFAERLREERNVDTHDVGFLYHLSAVPAAELLDDNEARKLAVTAADRLAGRYHELPGIIQAWGNVEDPEAAWPGEWGHGRMIADTMMNLPLLFWAAEASDTAAYRQIAVSHAHQTARHLVRDDGSTFHTFETDPETGEPLGGETYQGHADDSCWARGQTWTLYGMANAYRYTGHERFRRTAEAVADYYIDAAPDDLVPYWDLDFGHGDGEERDTSAGAMAACGLLELSRNLPAAEPAARRYRRVALDTLATLGDEFSTAGTDADGLLTNAVYDHPSGDGIEEATIWGDYFYYEGLVRATKRWDPYW